MTILIIITSIVPILLIKSIVWTIILTTLPIIPTTMAMPFIETMAIGMFNEHWMQPLILKATVENVREYIQNVQTLSVHHSILFFILFFTLHSTLLYSSFSFVYSFFRVLSGRSVSQFRWSISQPCRPWRRREDPKGVRRMFAEAGSCQNQSQRVVVKEEIFSICEWWFRLLL